MITNHILKVVRVNTLTFEIRAVASPQFSVEIKRMIRDKKERVEDGSVFHRIKSYTIE